MPRRLLRGSLFKTKFAETTLISYNYNEIMKNKSVFFKTFTVILFVAFFLSCKSEDNLIQDYPDTFLSEEVIKLINEKNIYFAHMSVGYNILDGISDLTDRINIQEIDKQYLFDIPAFSHSKIGENTQPVLKIDDFSRKITGELGDKVHIAFLKLCYVDISSTTDVLVLFEHYLKTFSSLENQYSDITFIHFTAPLTSQQKGIKAFIKKIIGREISGYEDNLKRQEFNELIRQNYTTVFDLAKLESTKPDGTRLKHTLNGTTYYSLFSGYTDDGGHLNTYAQKIIAQKLLIFISEIIQEKT